MVPNKAAGQPKTSTPPPASEIPMPTSAIPTNAVGEDTPTLQDGAQAKHTALPPTLPDDAETIVQSLPTSSATTANEETLGALLEAWSAMQVSVGESTQKVESCLATMTTHLGESRDESAVTNAALDNIRGMVSRLEEKIAGSHATLIQDLDHLKRAGEDHRVTIGNINTRVSRNSCLDVSAHAYSIFGNNGLVNAKIIVEATTAYGRELSIFTIDTAGYYSRTGFTKTSREARTESPRMSKMREDVVRWARGLGTKRCYEYRASWMDYFSISNSHTP
ncbi:uncharacterized protein CELE_ZK262.8 [Caenorhabditis elegans]|uniref:Uncharacterized protein n=1 Tax=Caenorhabditis elegans TaxID=6239 RepID=Q9U1N8_CAEEL|nr:Uncharacterized protein CELE_ZK262.8 [Caenorhabditis elegans]CAB63421.2 Uncharacterized protein CELE_ZK262.8 [Caenorhabditis elegans]|eukprot:NP_507609.2 Uncharacterized protein CELE_ZK262.8 [Caenorhabditis elegans]